MQIVIPMSGRGARFQRAGYRDIKPLIEVDGRPMVEHVVGMFPGESDFVFICAGDHLEATPLRATLESLVPGASIVAIAPHKLGPVAAVLRAAGHISDSEPVTLNYCDFSVGWDYADYKARVAELGCAGSLTAYRGFHPHSLGPNLYAYMREEDGYMREIREKGCFTDDRMNEYASSGTYYFQSGALMKRTFRDAVERDLSTGGEFYASTPYNLLVEQDLPVFIYELDYFLQWGTPEDLEEYQAWSDYFARHAGRRPSAEPSAATHLIPMAGEGMRFQREGYTVPKPLVPVAGVPMIERSLGALPAAERWIALVRSAHLSAPRLRERLASSGRDVEVVPVERLTEGQAATCLLARDRLDLEAPLLIGCCDAAVVFDEDRYRELTADPEIDCLVWTFRNHPHANRNPTHYGWVRADADGVRSISCKQPISDDVRGDPGIIGIFWFRKARFFTEAADRMIAEDRRINKELYVDTSIEVLVEQGRRARVFDVEHLINFGIPDDVRTYEYWHSYFRQAKHHPYGK
ncbi:MAG: NTP transferase domain-containing protein [bacterium]|nr:NTP transferase domain-containing protein [bacterium]